MRNRLSLKLRGALVVAATAIIAAVVSCGSLTGVPASLSVVSDSGVIYALNGAPSGAPTAVHFFTGSRTPADASFLFDVAFDIDTAGNPVLLPQRAVASGLTSTHSVGLQKTSTAFDQIASAPKTGYRADTAMVVTPGQAVLVQVQDPTCSVSITGTFVYGKLVIVAIDRASRTMQVEFVGDPNCGFLSFASGIPKS